MGAKSARYGCEFKQLLGKTARIRMELRYGALFTYPHMDNEACRRGQRAASTGNGLSAPAYSCKSALRCHG